MLRYIRLAGILAAFAVCLPIAHPQAYPSGVVTAVANSPQTMVAADFNRDGNMDVAYQDARAGGSLHILLGKGDGTFTTGQVIALPDVIGTVITVGDATGDGIPDLVLGYCGHCGTSMSGAIAVLPGNGDGTFSGPVYSSAYTYGSPYEMNYKMGIADFDGDGRPDIIYTDDYGYLYFMRGLGGASFAKPVEMSAGNNFPADVMVADLNGDGRPDLVVPGYYSFGVYLNQGGGSFSAPTLYTSPYYSTQQKSFYLGDLNGDGHPDVVFCSSTGQLYVAYGHADGTFDKPIVVASTPNGGTAITGIADLKGDHQQRVFVMSSNGLSVALGATPSTVPMYAATGLLSAQAQLGDFNNDGIMDVIVAGDQSIAILYGNADGTFNAAPSIPSNSYVGDIAMADVDNDGIPDAIIGPARIFHGNGDGTFATTPIGGGNYSGAQEPMYLGDFDADGNTDIFSYISAFFGSGSGSFTQDPLILGVFPYSNSDTYGAVADFNNDGHSDIAASLSATGMGASQPSSGVVSIALAGNGRTFTIGHINIPEWAGPIGTGDFDGDGCTDLIVGGVTQLFVLKGDCKGNFTQIGSIVTGYNGAAHAAQQTSVWPNDIAVADFDGDGKLDVVYTIPGASVARVLWGNGDGTFTQGTDITLAHSSIYVTAGDLDNDGYPDLVFSGQNINTVLHGQAGRTFSAPLYLTGGAQTGKAVLADLRNHGRLDITVPNGSTYTVFLNPLAARISNETTLKLTVSPEPSPYGQSFYAVATLAAVSNSHTPTGTVIFSIDGTNAVTSQVILGSAGATWGSAAVGTHTITAKYSGDANFAASTVSVSHTVTAVPTTTTLSCSPNPSNVFQNVLLSVKLTSTLGSPTGNVSLTDNGNPISQITLASGAGSYTWAPQTAGTHLIVATYAGDGTYATSNATCSQTVTAIPTTSTLTASPASPVSYGTNVLLTASVSSSLSSPTPTGTVTFYDNGVQIAVTALNSSGVATVSSTGYNVGSHSFTCTYSGDSSYQTSSCNTLPYTVTIAAANIALTSSLNPAPAGVNIDWHTVLTNNGSPLGQQHTTVTVDSLTTPGYNPGYAYTINSASGVGDYTLSLKDGTYLVTATYAGTSNIAPATATLTQVVYPNPTTISLTSSLNPAYVTQPVTFLTVVTPTYPNADVSGTVTIYDGATPITPLFAGPAGSYVTTSTLSPGPHTITATFTNPSFISPSTSAPLVETILVAATNTALTALPNPAYANQPVRVTATVSGPTGVTPSGNVTFSDGSQVLATMPVNASGQAVYTTSAFTVGAHPLSAAFTSNVVGLSSSASPTVVENILPVVTTTTLTAAPNPGYFGQNITMTANVVAASGTPVSGTVTFDDGATALATVPLNSTGQAGFATTTLAVGTHPLTAVFNPGVPGLGVSTSALVQEIIYPSDFTIALSPASVTAHEGDPASSTILLNSIGIYAGPLTLSYGQLPGSSTAVIAPATVTLTAGSSASANITLTNLHFAQSEAPRLFGWRSVSLASLLLITPITLLRRRRFRMLLLLLALLSTQALTGCVNAWYQAHVLAPGTYVIPVTATDQNQNSHSATLTLTVTP